MASPNSKLLTTCPACGTQVSVHAPACPNCGHPRQTSKPVVRPRKPSKVKYVLIIGGLALLGVLVSISKQDPMDTASRIKAEEECKKSLQCWASKFIRDASWECSPQVERLAKFDFKWTDSSQGSHFTHFRWKSESQQTVTYIGDGLRFQNGFGAWTYMTYFCDYDPLTKRVMQVNVVEGRMPGK